MARITRRKILKLSGACAVAAQTGGLTAIVTTGRAPALAQGTAPVVVSHTASLDLLLVNPQTVVAAMSATNSPASWSITSGDPNGYFYIDNSGVIRCTVAGELGLTPGRITLTIRATNVSGNGQGTATITVANPHGRVLYVATTGSDSNNGLSAATPFATFSHGYAMLVAGDLLLVAPGTYTDYNDLDGLNITSSGTSGAPIVVRSRVRGGATLDAQNSSSRNQVLYHWRSSWNVIAGFKIRNGYLGGVALFQTSNTMYKYNEVCWNGAANTGSGGGQFGFYEDTHCTKNTYVANFVQHNGRIAQKTNLDHGLYLCGSGTTVVNNIIFRNCSYGIVLAAYANAVQDLNIHNNVIMNQTTRSGICLWSESGQPFYNVKISNNIIVGNAGVAIYFAVPFHGTGNVADHNISYNNTDGIVYIVPSGCTSTNWLTSDPQFVRLPSLPADFRLQAGSPGIGSGIASAVWGSDFNGALRPKGAGWDMGVYER
jgi:hypothetical protein